MESAATATYVCFHARCARYRKEVHGMPPEECRAVTGYPPTCRSCGEPLAVVCMEGSAATEAGNGDRKT